MPRTFDQFGVKTTVNAVFEYLESETGKILDRYDLAGIREMQRDILPFTVPGTAFKLGNLCVSNAGKESYRTTSISAPYEQNSGMLFSVRAVRSVSKPSYQPVVLTGFRDFEMGGDVSLARHLNPEEILFTLRGARTYGVERKDKSIEELSFESMHKLAEVVDSLFTSIVVVETIENGKSPAEAFTYTHSLNYLSSR